MKQNSLAIFQSVSQSNNNKLSRIFNFCNNSFNNTGLENILFCMYGIEQTPRPRILYYNTNNINATNGVSVWQGITKYKNDLLIVGTSEPGPNTGQGVLYFGDITCNRGITYNLSVPGSEYSSVYGPRYNEISRLFTFVGSYTLQNDTNIIYAFLFRGTLNDLTNSSNYVLQMNYNPIFYTISFAHSTDGNFAVGNSGNVNVKDTNSWLYNITTQTYTTISFPNSKTTTCYGIIKNINGSYTIVGGCSFSNQVEINNIYIKNYLIIPYQDAFIADFTYDGSNITFSNFTSINYLNNCLTHFQGISSTNNPNIYTISADVIGLNNNTTGFFLTIERKSTTFIASNWTPIDYGKSINKKGLTTCNSVIDNNIVGFFIDTNNTSIVFQSSIFL